MKLNWTNAKTNSIPANLSYLQNTTIISIIMLGASKTNCLLQNIVHGKYLVWEKKLANCELFTTISLPISQIHQKCIGIIMRQLLPVWFTKIFPTKYFSFSNVIAVYVDRGYENIRDTYLAHFTLVIRNITGLTQWTLLLWFTTTGSDTVKLNTML